MNYADNTYHFRQDSSFLYYWGLDQANLAAVIDVDSGEETIFGDELTIDDIVWMGSLPTLRQCARDVGVHETRPFKELSCQISQAIKAGRPVHFLPPYRPDNMIQLGRWLELPPEKLREKASVEMILAVAGMRNIKSELEIAEIETAADITVDMHVAAMTMTRPGMREWQIMAEMHRVALASGGNLSFPIILTKNGQTLHNHFHGHLVQEGDLVLADAGAESRRHYAADMSSTFPVSPRFTPEQKAIYEIALAAHQAAVDTLAPGVSNRSVHLKACRTIAEGLKGLGLMKGDLDEAVALGAHALFFPCGTGHMMGLDVHDMEDLGEQYVGYENESKSTQFGLKSLRLARTLQPGFVLTIEPGIYFIPELIDLWKSQHKFSEFIVYDEVEKYRHFGGLRNEEDYLITPEGHRRLGKYKPMTVAEVETIRAG
jgi:Xaa-Pro aminopeptidase